MYNRAFLIIFYIVALVRTVVALAEKVYENEKKTDNITLKSHQKIKHDEGISLGTPGSVIS